MNCEQARQLFDAYLEGELSVPLATELGAHRVKCAECRRALALLEVSGHVLATDDDPAELSASFTDRLLACVDSRKGYRRERILKNLYIGGPLAAAAVVALAFLGLFDRNGEREVLGEKVTGSTVVHVQPAEEAGEADLPLPTEPGEGTGTTAADELLGQWLRDAQQNLDSKRESGESLQRMLDLTISQWLDIVEQAKRSSDGKLPLSDLDATVPAPRPKAASKEGAEVEDL